MWFDPLRTNLGNWRIIQKGICIIVNFQSQVWIAKSMRIPLEQLNQFFSLEKELLQNMISTLKSS